MNVLLVASDSTEPRRLVEIGFSSANLTKEILASEISPLQMKVMLQVGMSPLRRDDTTFGSVVGCCFGERDC